MAETEDKAKKPTPEQQEIATVERDTTRYYFGKTLTHEDDTLKTRGQGKSYKIYDELKRDAHAAAVLGKRKMAVTSRPLEVTPASEDARDVQAAELVRMALGRLRFNKTCKAFLDATLKGFAVGEVMWEIHEGYVLPKKIKAKRQQRFVFNIDEELRLLTKEQPVDGIELPPRKFIVHTHGDEEAGPYGLGVGHVIFWPVYFKRQGITFWLTFADKFGSPTSVGKYPTGATKDEQGKLLAALAAIAQDAGVIVPTGMEIDLLEATRTGSIDTYEKLCRYMDEQISEAVLGETMSTTAQSAGMGSTQADVHNDVRIELAEDDSNELCETFNETLVRWIVDFNLPGAGYPKLSREFAEPADLVKQAERDKTLGEMGYEPSEEYIVETYGEGWKKKAPAPTPAPIAAPIVDADADPAAAAFAEAVRSQRQLNRAEQDELILAADALGGNWRGAMGKQVADLLAVAEESGDLASFRENLLGLADKDPAQELVESIARARFAARLIGRGQDQRRGTASFTERLRRFFTAGNA
jgi:phage gp29-like protein